MARKRILTNEFIQKYLSREIDRSELSEILGRTESQLGVMLAKRGIKLWDRKIKSKQEMDYFCNLYKEKKYNRNQLVEKFGVKFDTLTLSILKRNIPLWDRKKKKNIGSKKTSRYYNWREFKNHIMMNYNR